MSRPRRTCRHVPGCTCRRAEVEYPNIEELTRLGLWPPPKRERKDYESLAPISLELFWKIMTDYERWGR